MDADLERRLGERGAEDGFELGFAERGQSRFGDVDVPSPLFGEMILLLGN